jgi:penicillin-binding protein 1A
MSPRLWTRRVTRVAVVTFVVVMLMVPAAAGVAVATYLFMPLPAVLPTERPQADSRTSIVYAADGSVIGEFREVETRVPIKSSEIPEVMKRAAIAAEDHEFFAHSGVDWRSIVRAFWADVRKRSLEQGGSTITQQLVKNLYTGGERTIVRKAKEALIAAQVERAMSKDEILTRYLNTVYMGDSVFGVEAAAHSYFRKSARDLNLSEAALLAGVLPAPSRYSPRRHPEASEKKRQLVLDAMARYGLATPQEVARAKAQKPAIKPHPQIQGKYPFFLDYLRVYLLDVQKISPDLLYRGGLRIETTLEPRLQDRAQEVVRRTVPNPKDPEASLVSVEPQTGFVRALVGGRNFEESKVNLALGKLGGGSGRQAGSAFKTFVLARALDAGVSPNKVYSAPSSITPRGFLKPVQNYEGGSYGSATIARATWKSINTVFVQLIVDVGIRQTAELAKRVGINSIDLNKPVYGGIAIGTQEVSPLDMASAYGVFANRGLRAEPTPVLRVLDKDGKAIEDNTKGLRSDRVLEEAVADNVTNVLKGVITSGTGTRAELGRPAAGKTGTSQNYENAWFVGYTPTLSTAVWMGYPQGNIPMRGIHGTPRVAGGTLPTKIWHDFMVEAMRGVPVTEFTEPAPIESLADRQKRLQRGGFDLGGRLAPRDVPSDGPYYGPPPLPVATVPTTTTTTEPPVTSTTTTTAPPTTTTTRPPFRLGRSSSTTTTTTTRPRPGLR